jgi:hypothetical protein
LSYLFLLAYIGFGQLKNKTLSKGQVKNANKVMIFINWTSIICLVKFHTTCLKCIALYKLTIEKDLSVSGCDRLISSALDMYGLSASDLKKK